MSSQEAHQDYEALEVIGKGSYGTVRKVRQKSNGNILVRKEIEYTSMNQHEKTQLISELRILRELNHPNIVKYFSHDHIINKKAIHIYMEYCDGGDLAQVITNFKKSKEDVPEEFIWQVLVQTLLALHRCHYGIDAKKVNLFSGNRDSEPSINSETVVIHRDIKPENIFILNEGKTIKLGDFGLAKMITSLNEFAKTYVGTPYYMSPEVLMDNPYSPVCDIWSLGCVLFELCNLQPPFQAKTHLQLQQKIKKGIIPELNEVYSSQLKSIIKECITVDPETRPSCYELLETLAIRFLRKEMELKEVSTNLNEFQKQLLIKKDVLNQKEIYINNAERKNLLKEKELEEELRNIQNKLNSQKKKIEEELMEEFEIRRKAMDQEAKEVRLGYQREFRLVVEHEVQQRLKEILLKQNALHKEKTEIFHPKSPQPNPRTQGYHYYNNEHKSLPKPKGPKELFDEANRAYPLKDRINYDYDSAINQHKLQYDLSPQRYNMNKKRITDELERLSLEKRNTPEYEDFYFRKNVRP